MYLAYFNLRGGRDEVLIHWDLFSCWEMGLATQGINNAWLFFGSQGGWGVGLLGFGDGSGGVFRFGNKHFGAAYHLRDECHILNILWSDSAW